MQRTSDAEPISARAQSQPRWPISRQTWQHVSLLHWPLAVDEVQSMLPDGLIADSFEGRSWISVVPFEMAAVRTPPLPTMGKLSNFPELNVRVYVHDLEGHRGVWFLGLWCTSASFVAITRALGLPYHRASGHLRRPNESHDLFEYEFIREARSIAGRPGSGAEGISFRAKILAGEQIDATHGLEAWLTARWNTFSVRAGVLWRFPVHHEPWQLRAATVQYLHSNIHEHFGLSTTQASPLVHTARPVHTRVSMPTACRR